jgi:AraC-like DNA-binding protein
MTSDGYADRLFPTTKLAPLLEQMQASGIATTPALRAAGLRRDDVALPSTRVSIDQVLAFYQAILEAAPGPRFAFQAGLRFHVTTYGMYGFAMLSSANYRQALEIAVQYHRLSTPLIHCSFQEHLGRGCWTIDPIPHPAMVGALYEFVVELHCGIFVGLHRDVMDHDFEVTTVGLTFEPPKDAGRGLASFDRAVFERASANRIYFPATLLDLPTRMGSPAVNRLLLEICDAEIDELRRRAGLAGRVRELLITNGCRCIDLAAAAKSLNLSERSLRRRLADEGASFRDVRDEAQLQTAIRYLRDTAISVEQIASVLGFHDAASFRRAFRRWTGRTPQSYRPPTA